MDMVLEFDFRMGTRCRKEKKSELRDTLLLYDLCTSRPHSVALQLVYRIDCSSI